MNKRDTYAIVIKCLPIGKADNYRFAIMVINRASDDVRLPSNNNFARNSLSQAIARARELQCGTLRPIHIALSGYARDLSVADADAVATMIGQPVVQSWIPVDPELERIKFYIRADADERANEIAQDMYDMSEVHYG